MIVYGIYNCQLQLSQLFYTFIQTNKKGLPSSRGFSGSEITWLDDQIESNTDELTCTALACNPHTIALVCSWNNPNFSLSSGVIMT